MTDTSGTGPAPYDRLSAMYPYLVAVRGIQHAVTARKDGPNFWLRNATLHGPKDVTVLETFTPAADASETDPDLAQANQLDRDAWAMPTQRGGTQETGTKIAQAAEALRADQPQNARVFLTDAARHADASASRIIEAHLNRLGERHPAIDGYAELARQLARDVRSSELAGWRKDRTAGALETAAGHLEAGRDVHAVYHLRKAATGTEGASRWWRYLSQLALELRVDALRDLARDQVEARQQADLDSDDGTLTHLRVKLDGRPAEFYTVQGTARAAQIAERADACGGAATIGEGPDEAAMSTGARRFRAYALKHGWAVSVVTDDTGAGPREESVAAINPEILEKIRQTWRDGRITHGGEVLTESKRKIAASPCS